MAELDELSVAIGALQADVNNLTETARNNQEAATEEHRKVHDMVATSEAVRNLARLVAEMKPLTDDYRERRAEARGAAKLMHALYVSLGGIAGAAATWLMQFFSARPHP